MMLATTAAFSKDVGLIITFIGLGVVVTIVIVYMIVQLRGEHIQNREYVASLSRDVSGQP